MHITDTLTSEKVVREPPRFCDEQPERGEKFRVPIQKRIKNIDNHMSKGTPVIDRCLPALPTKVSAQGCAAVLAMRERR